MRWEVESAISNERTAVRIDLSQGKRANFFDFTPAGPVESLVGLETFLAFFRVPAKQLTNATE
jgi:hypothetical protein